MFLLGWFVGTIINISALSLVVIIAKITYRLKNKYDATHNTSRSKG